MKAEPFHKGTEIVYVRHGHTPPVECVVLWAYRRHGRLWIIPDWPDQSELLPAPGDRWRHRDTGAPLGEFKPLDELDKNVLECVKLGPRFQCVDVPRLNALLEVTRCAED